MNNDPKDYLSTIHRIADTPPQFPCWLWGVNTQQWHHFKLNESGEPYLPAWTHWTHSETRPIVTPVQDAPTTPESWCKWRSMESAPKDGTRILVDGGDICAVVAWMNVSSGHRRVMAWAIPESEGDEQGGFQTIDDPIGWLLIPTRPSAKEATQ